MKNDENRTANLINQKDLDYIADTKLAMLHQSPRYIWVTLYLIIGILLFGLIWTYFAKIDIVTKGSGKVISSEKLQVVQNYEGGIVDEISVKEGQHVEKGQVLVVLDDTKSRSIYQKDLEKSVILQADIARLSAEAEGRDFVVPEDLEKDYPVVINNAKKLYDANQKALNEELAILNQDQALAEKELNIIKPLTEQGVMSKVEYLHLARQVNDIKGKILDVTNKAKDDARTNLNNAKAELALLKESMLATKDQLQRTKLRSPVNGIINKIYVTSVGEVVKPGENVVDVVPSDDTLTILANVSADDIGFLHAGQTATIKFGAYNYTQYGGLEATLENISADAITNKDGISTYEIKLKTKKSYLGNPETPLKIIPGMNVTVDIVTGKHRIITYIIKPFLKAKSAALRER